MITTEGSSTNYKGLSTDPKPTTGVEVNAIFLELDTKNWYYWDGSSWLEVGANA